ncbi:MAG: SusD/RagB family nutrient-binding outer membrane lipoprotein [Chitinophagaceae bacterium]|nr:SusD/RagB family nutrient-binding outer membrane lipoprotein [Chitinophagaceae bacterium]
MKKIIYSLAAILTLLQIEGCKKFLDVNSDPNNPTDVSEALVLAPVETIIATNITAGSFSLQNINGPAIITSYWMQELSLNQPQPQIDGYKLTTDDVDPIWFTLYSGALQNLDIINRKAVATGNHAYGAIAKVLTAYTLGVTTDLFGDIPFDDAFNGNFKPAYQSQEEIYARMHEILDSAILESGLDPGQHLPFSDDFIYNGDIEKWVKFAWALKARYHMRLTNAPGHDAVAQSNLALQAIDNAFTSADDEANFAVYSANPSSENPWFMNIGEDQGGVVLGKSLVDKLITRSDPRLPVIATEPNGVFLGRLSTTEADPDPTVYSVINEFYAGIDAPVSIFNYSELLFLKAEATLRTAGAAAATAVYQEAIRSHLDKLGISAGDADDYIASRGALPDAGGLGQIIEDKAIANFLSLENYNDWRRTGFPVLEELPSPYIPDIPVRFPYPLAEITSNSQSQHSLTVNDRVWWDGD